MLSTFIFAPTSGFHIYSSSSFTIILQSTLYYFLLLTFLNTECKWHSHARAIAEAVSCWLPTAAARVRARVWQVGFAVDKVASGQVFSEYFGFPCQNRSFH
jgi:hypothetical protein